MSRETKVSQCENTTSRKLKVFATALGISNTGDIMRLYAFLWLVFYLAIGNVADKSFVVALCILCGALPPLALGNYAGRIVERFGAHTTALWTHGILGLFSVLMALIVALRIESLALVLISYAFFGAVRAAWSPATECLLAELSCRRAGLRKRANELRGVTFFIARIPISIIFLCVAYYSHGLTGEIPRPIICGVLLFDAFTFFGVVVVLRLVSHETLAKPEQRRRIDLLGALHDCFKEVGAIPLLLSLAALWSFAYLRTDFLYGLLSEMKIPDGSSISGDLPQAAFWLGLTAGAFGGMFGSKAWRSSPWYLLGALVVTAIVESTFAFMPTKVEHAFVFNAVGHFAVLFLFGALDGLYCYIIQGFKNPASVSSIANMVRWGLSPLIGLGMVYAAKVINSPRSIIVLANVILLLLVAAIFAFSSKSIVAAFKQANHSVATA